MMRVRTCRPIARWLCGLATVAALLGLAVLLYLGPVPHVKAMQPPVVDDDQPRAQSITFATVQIFLDAGDQPLAAYQFELTSAGAPFKVVGLENGDSAVYTRPIDYDLNAQNIKTDRLILANYTTVAADQLPRGSIRVATIHVALLGHDGDNPPTINADLTAAYGPDGEAIDARSTVQLSIPQ